MIAVKRGLVMVGCALAFASGGLVVAAPAQAKECPWGTSATRFPGVCTKGSSMGGQINNPAPASPPGAPFIPNPNGVGTVLGIPCTPENLGKCIALQQSQGG